MIFRKESPTDDEKAEKMKKNLSVIAICLFSAVALSLFAGCGGKTVTDIWQGADYSEDTCLGDGQKEFFLEVSAGEHSVTLTVRTDKDTVGDALLGYGLIDGEEGAYGLYVKSVNGIVADYDSDKSYWAFYINGEFAATGVDSTEITEGAVYQFVYTK